jgi:serine/threonine-protein kinase
LALLEEHIEGKYEILEKLREGGMGAIYKVRHRLLDEVRVVKVIRSNMAASPEAGDRFVREARVAIRLRHPNIAQLHDFAVAGDGTAYIVMELIDGLTLQEILRRHGTPALPLSLEIARQALKALGYLHRQKIVHRDVSPDNLMLTRDVDGHPLVKLIDLGIAKAFEGGAGELTSTGIFLGKPRYAAPEQFSGTALDARSDVYSFAVVFYELLTGRCPISGNDATSYMAGHLLRPPMPFAESDPDGRLPDALREALSAALVKEPERRTGSAEELLWAITMVQDRFTPPATADLDAALAPAVEEELTTLPALPGSTQSRLDHEFWVTTPLPATASPDPTMPTLGRSLADSIKTVRLTSEDPERTRLSAVPAPPADPGATRESPRPSAPETAPPPRPSVLDDLTWVTGAARPVPPPAPAPAAPLPAAAPTAGRGKGIAIAAACVFALALAAGAAWWLRRPAAPEVASPVVPQPAPFTAPAATKTVEVAPPPEPSPSTAPGSPVPPSAVREQPKIAVPEDPAPAASPSPADLAPMQRGDLIRRGQPNVEEPEPVEFPKYTYPAAARGSGKTARLRVAVLVDENGKVIDAQVREGDASGLGFNEAALDAARQVPYQPATRDGVPGKMWTELIFEFAE